MLCLFVPAALAQSHRQSEKSRAEGTKSIWLFDALYVHNARSGVDHAIQSNYFFLFLSFQFFPSAGWQKMTDSCDYYGVQVFEEP